MKTPQSVRIAAALMTCALLSTAPLAMAQGYEKARTSINGCRSSANKWIALTCRPDMRNISKK
jgi:hypothetical protein